MIFFENNWFLPRTTRRLEHCNTFSRRIIGWLDLNVISYGGCGIDLQIWSETYIFKENHKKTNIKIKNPQPTYLLIFSAHFLHA
jgi:UPF0288 family protein (methanogenesis marker protein 3)